MKLSLALAVLLAHSASAERPQPTCLDSGAATGPTDSTPKTELNYDGFTVYAMADSGTGGAMPGGDLLNLREATNGCSKAIEFQVLQNFKTDGGSGVITTGSGISHINVAWTQCDGMCSSDLTGCQKFESDLEEGSVYPDASAVESWANGVEPNADGWYTACCIDGKALITIQYADGQLQTDRDSFSTCNPVLDCISGKGDPEKNADYVFEVICPGAAEPATPEPTPGPTSKPPPPPADDPSEEDPGTSDECPNNMDYMGSAYSTICKNSGVKLEGVHPAGATLPELAVAALEDMFFGIQTGDNLSLRVQNPFKVPFDMYVVYEEPYSGPLATGNARKNVCVGDPGVDQCTALAEGLIESVCQGEELDDVAPFAIFDVYFVDTESASAFGGSSTTVHECCEAAAGPTKGWTSTGDAIDESSSVLSFTFSIACTCPMERARQLRGFL